MLKKYFKNVNPLHFALISAGVLVALTILVLIIKTINFGDFIAKTENKTFDSRQVMLVNNHVKKPNKNRANQSCLSFLRFSRYGQNHLREDPRKSRQLRKSSKRQSL